MSNINYDRLINIGILFSTERNTDKLIETILSEAMEITSADGGTIYLCKDNMLDFKIMHNFSMNVFKGSNGEFIDLPPVPMTERNVCTYVAIHERTINIGDIYENDEFDFSGARKYDELNNYRTKSMLVHPLINNRGELMGVMQLINALDEEKNIIPFETDIEYIISALAAQAAVALTNITYLSEVESLLHSFVEVFTEAIEKRTPYNANHTKSVAKYTAMFIDYINALPPNSHFTKRFDYIQKKELLMAAMLHDVGKITTPLEVMNKSTRLSTHYDKIMDRLYVFSLRTDIKFLCGKLSQEETEKKKEEIEKLRELVNSINEAGFVSDDLIEQVGLYNNRIEIDEFGNEVPYLLAEEIECLCIRKGTLTAEERKIMEGHVITTRKLLDRVPFNSEYKHVPEFAGVHHETLDGKGYPLGLRGEEIPIEGRILAMLDIFDALTSRDRPYRSVMGPDKAMEIISDMVDEGKLDAELFELFKQSEISRTN